MDAGWEACREEEVVVEFRLLGAVHLSSAEGHELRAVLAQPKRVALLAYLAAASPGKFHRRDSLVALFWPELDQEHARAALRQALHGLRRSLGSGAIAGRGDEEVRLDDRVVWCDVIAFEAALAAGDHAEALRLYGGDLLDGFFISGAPDFERWLEDHRAALRRRAVQAGFTLSVACGDAGDVSLAAHWARQAAALVRDDEETLRRLIGRLDDLGDRAAALQAYETFARRLASDYEVAPAAETKALIAVVRAREHAVVPPAPLPVEPYAAPVHAAAAHPPTARRRRIAVPILVAALALATVTFTAWNGADDAVVLDPTRVVVAGVWNRTGDSTFDALAALAREEITRGLALTEVVEVADPGSVRLANQDLQRPLAPQGQEAEAAHALAVATGSGLAVWGTIHQRGDEIELSASIVNEQSGEILRTFDPVHADPRNARPALTTLRDRIMVVVAEAMDPRLAASASVAGGPPRYEAYTAFITGVGIWYDGRNGRQALPHFRRAADLDSTFALPLIWAAWVHQTFGQCDSTEAIAGSLATMRLSRLEHMQIGRQMARCRGDLAEAYRLAHALADARPRSEVWQEQLARDALNFGRPREALRTLERLDPDHGALRGRVAYYNWVTNAHHLLGQHARELEVARRGRAEFPGNLAAWRTELMSLAALGRGREVLARLDEIDGLAADPLRRKPTVMREIALDLAAHGDPVAARAALARTLAWHAAQPAAVQSAEYNRFDRARSYHAAGHADSARVSAAALAGENAENVQYAGLLGVLAAERGDHAAAVRIARHLASLNRPYGRGQSAYWRACIAARSGRRDEAVRLLRQAMAEGHVFNDLFFLTAHLEPSFAPLRGLAAFEDLLRPRG